MKRKEEKAWIWSLRVASLSQPYKAAVLLTGAELIQKHPKWHMFSQGMGVLLFYIAF